MLSCLCSSFVYSPVLAQGVVLLIPQWVLVPSQTNVDSLLGVRLPSWVWLHPLKVTDSRFRHQSIAELDFPLYFLSPFGVLLGRSVKEAVLMSTVKRMLILKKDARARRFLMLT